MDESHQGRVVLVCLAKNSCSKGQYAQSQAREAQIKLAITIIIIVIDIILK